MTNTFMTTETTVNNAEIRPDLAELPSARKMAGLTQQEMAIRMGTTKSAVSRLEASLRDEKHSPSVATLKKYAQACGKRLVVQMI